MTRPSLVIELSLFIAAVAVFWLSLIALAVWLLPLPAGPSVPPGPGSASECNVLRVLL